MGRGGRGEDFFLQTQNHYFLQSPEALVVFPGATLFPCVFMYLIFFYVAMVHCGSVRQTAAIISLTSLAHEGMENIRTGDKCLARLRFTRSPEFLREGARIVFREGRTKAIGVIAAVHKGQPFPIPTRKRGMKSAAGQGGAV